MTSGILQAKGLCKSYKDKQVLKNLDITIEPGKIYGLIGRNGAGKTTLLGILTAQNTHDSGEVTYNGEPVCENPKALEDLCFSRELQANLFYGQNNLKVRHYLQAGATFYPRWDEEYARRLLKEFGVEEKKRVSQLSKGQLSMVTILIALAISAAENPLAKRALDQLSALRGCEAHSTVILSQVDTSIYSKLGMHLTTEPQYETNKLYHK